MNHLFLSIFKRFGLYYGFVNRDMKICFDTGSVYKYLSLNSNISEFQLTDIFQELIGIEFEIQQVIDGIKNEFSIKGINRFHGTEITFNLYFFHYRFRNYEAIAVIRDVTNETLFRQSLQQSRNEIILLQHELIEKNQNLDITNKELLKSRDDLNLLNAELEETVQLRTKQFKEKSELADRLFHQTVNSLTYALEMRDPYTAGHQLRVSKLAGAIAKKLDLSEDVVTGIMVTGSLHDIGKIYVPSEFLTKPGKLPEEAMNVIKTHPRIGYEILKDIEFPWPVAAVILQHHERNDGSGYPLHLKKNEIMLESKILCVADVVEAMGTNRPYRISPGLNAALEEIEKNSGIKYERCVVDTCIGLFRNNEFSWDD
jgi:putative nucleotidyltransferase with HDIG domain